MQYLIGLDIGTSSVKGILMTVNGHTVKSVREEFIYSRFLNGFVEIQADNYLVSCIKTMRELVESADGPVLGICASSASGNLLVTDKNGHPACPIVNWRDTRVGNEAFNILGKIDTEDLYNRTGWPFDYRTFPLAQLCYIREHSPSIIDDAGTVCMSTEYLYYTLTGKWGISTSAGTPFYLIDQQKGTYISEILDALLIRENQLPPVFSCGSVLGCITHEASRAFNLPEGIPIVLGSFDHPSAARGAGVLKEGEILLSCGTSWVVFFPAVSRELLVKGKFLIDPFLSPGGCWGGMVSAAALSDNMEKYVHRYIDNSENSYRNLASLAEKCLSGAGGLKIHPTDPPDDSKVQGFNRNQIARAIMEGGIQVLKAQLDRIERAGIRAETAVMVGGPTENPLWSQIIEEICGISIRMCHGANAGAVGAAILAGIGVGIYQNEAEAHSFFEKHRKEEQNV